MTKPRLSTVRALAAAAWVAFVLLFIWGCAAMGAPGPLGRLVEPATVSLDAPLPHVVHGPLLVASGQTRTNAFIRGSVDGRSGSLGQADHEGRFAVTVELGNVGLHAVEIDVTYRSAGDPPDESIKASVTRTEELVPPRLLAVASMGGPDLYEVALVAPQGAAIDAEGAVIVKAPMALDTARGRPVLLVRAPAGSAVAFRANDGAGSRSEPTDAVDLAALAREGVQQAAADQTETDVTYRIDHAGVSRVEKVVLDPARPELRDLIEGREDVLAFLESVAGPHGLSSARGQDCVVGHRGSERPTIEIGDRATVTLTDDFPDFVSMTNGIASRPAVTLCFRRGFPIPGDSGRVEIRVEDFGVTSSSPQPASITNEVQDSGAAEQVYTWDQVPPQGTVTVVLAVDAPTTLGLIPKARIGDLIPNARIASLTSGVFFPLIQAAGLLLLLWVTTSPPIPPHVWPNPRRAVAHVLILGVALAFVSAIAQISTTLGHDVYDAARIPFPGLPAGDVTFTPSVLGGLLLTTALIVGGGVVFGYFHRDRSVAIGNGAPRRLLGRNQPLLSAVGFAIAVAGMTWVVITIAGPAITAVVDWWGVPEQSVPAVAAWIVGSGLLALVLAFTWRRLQAVRLRPGPVAKSARVAVAGWGALAAIVLAFPAGREGPGLAFADSMRSFVALMAYAYALVGIAAVILLVRRSWYRTSWEWIVDAKRQSSARASIWGATLDTQDAVLRRLGRVVFAGYVIGTAGVFAVLPIPFLIAFPLFDRLLLRRPGDTRHLARDADCIRLRRKELLHIRLPEIEKDTRSDPPAANGSQARSKSAAPSATHQAASERSASTSKRLPTGRRHRVPACRKKSIQRSWLRNVTAIGPRWPIWSDIVLALQVGAVVSVALVLLYLTQYPFDTVTTGDPYYLQRLGLNVAAFAGSWIVLGFFFGLMYANLRGESGLRKGLWLGAIILGLTLPFQLLSTLASDLPLWTITIRVLQVLAFTVIVGLTFDVWLLHRNGRLKAQSPRSFVGQVGGVSGTRLLWTGLLFVGTSIVGTLGTILTGQLTALLTRVLTPFLPVPPA